MNLIANLNKNIFESNIFSKTVETIQISNSFEKQALLLIIYKLSV